MKKLVVIILMFLTMLASQAFEDCIVVSDGKLTDISIEDNTILDVYPLVTLMNDKNTLIVHPLKEGNTRFCVLKNNKNIVMFNVNVTSYETLIEKVDGFEILSIDEPNNDNWLDLPPASEVDIGGQNG